MNPTRPSSSSRLIALFRSLCVALPLGLAWIAQPCAQQTGPVPSAPASEAKPAPTQSAPDPQAAGITEEQLRQLLIGKPLYLRSCYIDNALAFNEHGAVTGHPTPGSYTLCGVEFNKVKLSKHKLELFGDRYGLHFLGALPYEDPTKAADRVRITDKKKILRITIDRELVVKPKKVKEKKPAKTAAPKTAAAPASAAVVPSQSSAPQPASPAPSPTAAPSAAPPAPANDSAEEKDEPSEAEQLKASIAAAPEAEKPADPKSVTTTTSPAHSAQLLRDALDKIFASRLDDRMMASMPDFWKLYYQAVASRSDYRPQDSAVLRQNTVDKRARLLTNFEPASNEYAQASGVAGMALYHAVIGPDGKPGEIAVARPIGFGLDENAVQAIRNARFEPALKGGKPVSVLIDLVVQFRIFSGRTAIKNALPAADKPTSPEPVAPTAPVLPGPYSRPQN